MRFSNNSFEICNINLTLTCFGIGFRCPTMWNKFLTKSEKSHTSIAVFKNKITEKIINFCYKFSFF